MNVSVKELTEALERIFQRALPYGLAILLLSLSIRIAMWFKLIGRDAFEGWLLEIAGLGFALAGALIVFGMLLWIGRLVEWFGLRRLRKTERQRLLENVNLVPWEAKVLLYRYLSVSSGRFSAPFQQRCFNELLRRELVHKDSIGSRVTDYRYTEGEPFRVNSTIFSERATVLVDLRQQLSDHYKVDIGDAREFQAIFDNVTKPIKHSWMAR